MRVYAFLGLLVLLMLIVTSSFTLPAHATPAWTIQTISTSAVGPCGIVLDSNNYPHIAYSVFVPTNNDYSSGNGIEYVIYASWNGSMWINQKVAANAGFLDLALDSHNNPHILFESGENLTYASWTGSSWSIQTVDAFWNGVGASLALDSNGNPHIAYFTNGNATSATFLKYTSWNGSYWSSQIVDAGNMLYDVSLKLDGQNQPHIMYTTQTIFTPTNTSETLKYATPNNVSGWNIQPVQTMPILLFGNMVLDSNGYPHFIYTTVDELTYASWTGSEWNNQTTHLNDADSESYVTLDKQNYPHIVYSFEPYPQRPAANSNLTYALWTGSEWDIQSVASSATIEAGSIAIDSNGNPYICYFTNPNYLIDSEGGGFETYNLMYATTTEPAPTTASFTSTVGFTLLLPVVAVVIVVLVSLAYILKKNKNK